MTSPTLHPTLNTPTAAVNLTVQQMAITSAALRDKGFDDIADMLDRERAGYGPTGTLVLRGAFTVWGYDPQDGQSEGLGAAPTRTDDVDLIRPGVRIVVRNASAFEATRLIREARSATD